MGRHLVYAKAGETIHMGSSVAGLRVDAASPVGSIILKSPTGTILAQLNTYSPSSGYGRIENRAEELAGPKFGGKTVGYDPLSYTVAEDGIYEVTFGALGTGTTIPETAFYNANTSSWTQPISSSASAMIIAWDVTVSNAANEELEGRVYMNVFNGSGPNGIFNQRTFYPTFYVLTPQSWVYEVNNNGQNGASFNFFSNNKGPRASSVANAAPLYGSLEYTDATISTLFERIWDPRNVESSGNYTNKIFYNEPDLLSFPSTAPIYYSGSTTPSASTTWLKGEPIVPEIQGVVAKCGGVIRFLSNVDGHYQILIDGNGDGLFNSSIDRVLNGNAKFGENEIVWDGKNGLGTDISSTSVTVNIRVTTGEVHFPFVDVEANDSGIIISRMGAGGNDTIYWNDAGTTIGSEQKAPTPLINHSGVSSSINGHKWSTNSTNHSQANYFGNNKLLDTWTFVFDQASISINYFACLNINGRVWNDANGDGSNAGELGINGLNTGSGIGLGDTLYVYLLDSNNVIIDRALVNADGTYSLTNVPRNESGLKISISTALELYTNTFTGPQLPPTWIGASESIGAGNSATQVASGDMYIQVNTTTANINNQNIGIQQAPTASSDTLYSQMNPNGTNTFDIPNDAFIFEDFNGGHVSQVVITEFPNNATSITIGDTTYYPVGTTLPEDCMTCLLFPTEGVSVNVNATTGNLEENIAIDPIDGTVTVDIPFIVIDNAGAASNPTDSSILSIPFIGSFELSGNILNDITGLTNDSIDGAILLDDLNMNVYLVDSNGIVIAKTEVVDGTYQFENILEGTYSIIISSDSTTVINTGDWASDIIITLPSDWALIGENIGTGSGHDGNPNGIIENIVVSNNIENINFGIKEIPVATVETISTPIINPGGNIDISDLFGGSEPNGVNIDSLHIVEFPSNTNTITIGSITYYDPANPPTSTIGMEPFPSTGITIPTQDNGTPAVGSEISIDPIDGNIDVNITFTVKDETGLTSYPVDMTIPFQSVYSIAGTVIIDPNGLTDSVMSGSPLNENLGLTAVLVNEFNQIINYAVIDTLTGSYQFNDVFIGTYNVMLTNAILSETMLGEDASTIITSVTPENWILVGEKNDQILENTIDGVVVNIEVTDNPVNNINFAIQALPYSLPVSLTVESIPTIGVPIVLENPFTGTDREDTYGDTTSWFSNSVLIHTLPTDGFILKYDGIEIGIGDTITNYDPTLLTIEPSDLTPAETLTTSFTYSVLDQSTSSSTAPATYTINFEAPLAIQNLALNLELQNDRVYLEWSTTQESNVDYFEVQKSNNGYEWTLLTKQDSKAAGNQIHHANIYSSIDENPYTGRNYYRIKQVANNGIIEYSDVKSIDIYKDAEITIYPNPIQNTLNIMGVKKGDKISIINTLGMIIYQTISDQDNLSIDCSKLPSGNYNIQIVNDQNLSIKKFTKI